MNNEERKPQLKFLSGLRRDGKYKVSLYYPGGPNMFGGYYPGRSFTKLYTPEQCRERLDTGLYEAHNVPSEVSENE